MVIAQGDIWWTDFGEPRGSEPGFRRPAIVVQGDELNRSKINTVVCVPLTSNLGWSAARGNVELKREETGLSKDSVANVSQIIAVDKRTLIRRAGRISKRQLMRIFGGIDLMLGRKS